MPRKSKRKRGRPPIKTMRPPMPDSPEAIALACMQGPPKQEWDNLKAAPTDPKAGYSPSS